MQRALERARARRADEGFTLIELLIVIVILGILAAIVIFSVKGITDSAHKNSCKSDLQSVNTAIEGYYAQNGVYADTTAQLAPYFHGSNFPGDVALDSHATPPNSDAITVASGNCKNFTPGINASDPSLN